jgi:peptidyl-tRNA hydrolase
MPTRHLLCSIQLSYGGENAMGSSQVRWQMMEDPYRMYLVVRRGAFEGLEVGCVLAGGAAVGAVRRFAEDELRGEAVRAWRERPGKVTLRARGGQWEEVLRTEDFAYAGDLDGASVLALPPMRRSERSELLAKKLQTFASELTPLAEVDGIEAQDGVMTYVVNPSITMSTGKTMAQVAHAATMASYTGQVEAWIDAGCPARAVTTTKTEFERLRKSDELVAKVEDAGLTEVPPGTITVLALPPAQA